MTKPYKHQEKPFVDPDEIEEALKILQKAVKKGSAREIAQAEECVHAIVMKYTRSQSHSKMKPYDHIRDFSTSSELASEITLYLYRQKHLPNLIQALKDEPTEEKVLEIRKRLLKLISLKTRRMPIDLSREQKKIPLNVPLFEQELAMVFEGKADHDRSVEYRELADIAETIVGKLSEENQKLFQLYFLEGHTQKDAGELVGLKPDAARKRLDKIGEDLKNELVKRGYEVNGSDERQTE